MIKSGFLLSLFVFIGTIYADAQISYGTTGLMNMPTADMQRDKTFMAGANWLNHHATVPRGRTASCPCARRRRRISQSGPAGRASYPMTWTSCGPTCRARYR